MRKWLILIIILLSSELFASQSFVFSRNISSDTLTYSFNSNGVRFTSVLNQDRYGKFSVNVPPFLSIKTKDRFFVGVLKIDPDEKYSNLVSTDSPSLSPALSGIGKAFRNVDLAVFSPVLNPLSPSGFFVSYHNSRLNVNLTGKDYSKRAKDGIAKHYQIDWDTLKNCSDSLSLNIHLNESLKADGIRFSSDVFCKMVFDKDLGSSCSSSWVLDTEGDNLRFNLSRNMDANVIQNKINMRTKGVLNFGFFYGTKSYPKPVYGGHSKGYSVEYAPSFSYKGFTFSCTHSIEILQDSGHVESSDYKIRYYRSSIDNNYLSGSLSVKQNRGESDSFNKLNLKFRDKNAMIEFGGNKTLLSLSHSWYVNGMKFKITITQDRVVTLSLKTSS